MTNTRNAIGSGFFITFEGPEGSGKSTQMKLLAQRLRSEGHAVMENQEPGATDIGRQIRRILLAPENDLMAPMTELLLMFASRTQAAAEIILPALERGEIVISDRFTDSTLAYQGAGRGIGFETVMQAHRLALGELMPNLTVYVQIDVKEGVERALKRNAASQQEQAEARLDQQSLAFHQRVNAGYLRIAALEPDRFHLVDGTGSISQVAERIWTLVRGKLGI
jgi:dTMP kinase